ncbi:hypothetical protein PSAB6_60069 [Paraburkholderia sabiae]|uniref:hypothetical protein n=1 Tax=Paraburkholderia sabiae TaxID=273251 RepID=UPI001CB4AECF|nr:hypothetical protein [Paraburkholderia sabiae]CAG9233308.1 hypothetical protein PSAB6_60069 [Paraburkholderia sabiae]
MRSVKFHPPGLIIRVNACKTYRYAIHDRESGQEVHAGTNWDAAYTQWLTMRRRTATAPQALRVSWLITEFGERHGRGAGKARVVFSREMHLLIQAIQKIGDPLVEELNEAHCQAFRLQSQVGPVRTETLVRRLRQVWRWAGDEGLTNRACPWVARVQDQAIQIEVIDIVARFLPKDILDEFRPGRVEEMEERVRSHLSIAVSLAVRRAIGQLLRAGRPDLVPALRRCELQWFLDHQSSKTADLSPDGELQLDHDRITRVLELRRIVRTGQRTVSEANSRDFNVE